MTTAMTTSPLWVVARRGGFSCCFYTLSMAATQIVCRLCVQSTAPQKAMSLFSKKSVERDWACRVSSLLEVPVTREDHLPAYICYKCKTRILSLEKALADLQSFKLSAKSALQHFTARPPVVSLKRAKQTSGNIGVSPDTLRERPCSKLTRKRLDFSSNNYKYF